MSEYLNHIKILEGKIENLEDLLRDKFILDKSLTPEQIAAHYTMERDTAYRLIRSGKIEGFKMGGGIHVYVHELKKAEKAGIIRVVKRRKYRVKTK